MAQTRHLLCSESDPGTSLNSNVLAPCARLSDKMYGLTSKRAALVHERTEWKSTYKRDAAAMKLFRLFLINNSNVTY